VKPEILLRTDDFITSAFANPTSPPSAMRESQDLAKGRNISPPLEGELEGVK
jgi:hypothetical protein